MNYNELKKLINSMTPVQRKTEVCVFEEGTRKYIWPARLAEGSDPNRPYLEGVADEGDPDVEFFDPKKAKGTKNRDVDSVKAHPTELDSPQSMRPDRVRKARPTGLDASMKKGGKKRK